MIAHQRSPFTLSLTGALVLHLSVTAVLIRLTAPGPWSPPQPLDSAIEVTLVNVEAPAAHSADSKPVPPDRHVTPPAHRVPPPTPPVVPHHNEPVTPQASPTTTPSVTEPAPEAPTTSLFTPENSAPNLPENTGEAIAPPQYDAAYLSNPPPLYPPLAKRLNIEGRSIVRVLVNPSGKPEQIELVQSSGSTLLDRAALNAVRRWTFIPARQGTEAVPAWVEVPIRFHLQE